MTTLYRNHVVLYKKKHYRLVDFVKAELSPNGWTSWAVICLDDRKPLPELWPTQELAARIAKGEATRVDIDEPAAPHTPSAVDMATQAKRWSRIQELVRPDRESHLFGRTHELWDKKKRKKLLDEHAAHLGTVTSKTLFADWRLYLRGGQNKSALCGSTWKCGRLHEDMDEALVVDVKGDEGNTVKIYAPGKGRARGRRPASGDYEPFLMPRALRRKLLVKAQSIFLKDETVSIRKVADDVLGEMFAKTDADGKRCKDEHGDVVLVPLGQRPSEDQVRYILRTSLSEATKHRKRVSESDFGNNHASSTGSVHDDAKFAGDVYEIDATRVDLFLVSRHDRRAIIGMATLYLVVDRKTNLIVGLYLSLENPKWEECKLAVLSVCGDWKSLCERLGVKYRAEAFPAQGVFPNRWVGDRGEFLCFGSDILTHKLGQQVTNLGARQARKKCRVEGGFHVTSVVLKDNAKGYSFPRNAKKRQGKRYEKDACHNFEDLLRIYLKAIIAHNVKPMNPKIVSPEFLETRQEPSPANFWRFDIQNNGAPSVVPYEVARRAVTPIGQATVRHDGVEFMGLSYDFDESKKLGWFSDASLTGVSKVSVGYSPSLVDSILIYDKANPSVVYQGRLTKQYAAHFKGYSFKEFSEYQKDLKKFLNEGKEIARARRIGLAEAIREINDPAYEEMKELTKNMALATRIAMGAELRKDEARERRQAMHDLGDLPASHVGGVIEGESESAGAVDSEAPDATPAETRTPSAPAAKKSSKKPMPKPQAQPAPAAQRESAVDAASTEKPAVAVSSNIAALMADVMAELEY